ncbi:cytochrome b5 reductase 4 [Trichoderma asperellum]|uniref:Cytochrome b5 reductase 4 n=1 Tax=Trichoderma asperellum TaxID=101201 RepID=A0A6V8QVZ0_TRIAP|nr:cytochrome b5 reductase 4 [Trichoderma asperellum]
MAVLGISLIVASVVFVILRPPQWLLLRWQSFGGLAAITDGKEKEAPDTKQRSRENADTGRGSVPKADVELKGLSNTTSIATASGALKQRQPPTIMPPTVVPPSIEEPESPTTPKAQVAKPSHSVPSLSLSADAASSMMPPPPLPSSRPSNGRIPALSQFPAPNSAQRARGPAPNRGPAASSSSSSSLSSGLAPPPTLAAKPQKPSRQVVLTPGHSPLDWARISGPNADLRGVAPSTPYLRVTPSMLKTQTGRKGKDAWMAINGKVYNVTPYARFHPGGVPELMRGAGRDGTKLFGEIHPWVNYETMLAACLVGLLVEESDGKENDMDQMD